MRKRLSMMSELINNPPSVSIGLLSAHQRSARRSRSCVIIEKGRSFKTSENAENAS